MGTIRVQNVTCQFGGQVVLRDVSLDLHDGEIVGVVGPNGAGKSTLFKLIAGLLPLELGTITRSKGLEVGYLAQEPQLESHRSVLAEVSVGLADLTRMERRLHELAERIAAEHGTSGESQLLAEYDRLTAQFQAAGGYEAGQRLREIVGGLGFSQEDLDRPVGTLSGGQKCRVALARLLLEDRQFLLLDEPTNHLDIDAVRWLERFLAGHHGGAAIISHDRYLLDRVAQKIIEVDRQTVTVYTGNYSTYADTRALRRLSLERQYERDAAFLAKEREFIARHLAGQRTKEAQGRRDRLERRLAAGEFVLEKPKERKGLEFSFSEEKARSGPVLRVEDLAKSFPNRRLFADLNLNLEAGKCLGITGPNGTGKTTLLRILLGQLPPDAGEVQFQPQLSIGYYAQEAVLPNPEQTPLEAIHAHRPALDETRIRSLLGRFGFRGDDVFKPLGRCSGGEQSRVRLLGLILDNPNMLVLDEPTNHLDIAAREALEDALLEFPGAILVVSHDRYFLDRLVDDLLVMRPEGTRLHRGDYSSYIAELEAAKTEAASPSPAPTAPAGRGKAAPDRSPRAGSRQPRPTAKYDALSIEQIEELIIQREEEVARLTERFADPQLIRDPAGLARLHADIDALKAELAVLDAAWHERADAV